MVDVDLVNIALSAIFSRKQRERGREGENRRKKNGYSVIHVGRGVRIATREGKKGARRLIVSFARRIGAS